MSDFLYFTKTFLKMDVYWVNTISKKPSLVLTTDQIPTNGFLKLGTGRLLKSVSEISDSAVWQNKVAEKSEI